MNHPTSIHLSEKSAGRSGCTGVMLAAAIVLAAWSGMAGAQSANRIYRCSTPDGTPLYQNTPGKGCALLDLPPVNSVPVDRMPVTPPTRRGQGSSNAPKVTGSQQQGRDSDRRRILEDELAREEKHLADVRQRYNDGQPERHGDERNYQKYLDRVEQLKNELMQSESNVRSLRREIDALR
ncbi:MAG: DUF4124 domain-containing protein [Lautropia sp.]|nr:DUF4124 domain-containing protein [Lautropia sp.]